MCRCEREQPEGRAGRTRNADRRPLSPFELWPPAVRPFAHSPVRVRVRVQVRVPHSLGPKSPHSKGHLLPGRQSPSSASASASALLCSPLLSLLSFTRPPRHSRSYQRILHTDSPPSTITFIRAAPARTLLIPVPNLATRCYPVALATTTHPPGEHTIQHCPPIRPTVCQ
ncbi:hypothetical protein CALCODRAFT_7765 [Calocera cornea HHB12733]|uniref:Uncharacterized protein n=1 Tax=Calocera cornea HHB12733 TaxID=1353952 RepID=A0A165KD20_9BASI|nr:hypothetical protein CALCODRAFT_7765 [Calocera cornea HHB12733]